MCFFPSVTDSNWFESSIQKQLEKKILTLTDCVYIFKGKLLVPPSDYSHCITTSRSFQKPIHTRVGNSSENHTQQGRGVVPFLQENVYMRLCLNVQ